jgi:hypothetical protein
MRKRPEAVAPVLAQGDMRASLAALRDRLAVEIDEAPAGCSECGRVDGRVIATLTKELTAVLARLDEMPMPEGASRIDELASARKARQGGRKRSDPARTAERPAASQ